MPAVDNEVAESTYREVRTLLFLEAKLLDGGRQREWLDQLIDPAISYEIPVRVTRERSGGKGFSSKAFHMRETWGSLETRVARLESEYAWAEDPPSRTRRFVTNIEVAPCETEDELVVNSNLLVYRSRYDATSFQLLCGERWDTLRRHEDSWKILRRRVLLDHTTLPTHNLGIFL